MLSVGEFCGMCITAQNSSYKKKMQVSVRVRCRGDGRPGVTGGGLDEASRSCLVQSPMCQGAAVTLRHLMFCLKTLEFSKKRPSCLPKWLHRSPFSPPVRGRSLLLCVPTSSWRCSCLGLYSFSRLSSDTAMLFPLTVSECQRVLHTSHSACFPVW